VYIYTLMCFLIYKLYACIYTGSHIAPHIHMYLYTYLSISKIPV